MTSAPMTMHLPCPKCALPMRVIERNGVHVEQCPECRGLFLDRGELDRLLDLDSAASRTPQPDQRPEPRRDDRRDRSRSDDYDDDDDWSDRSGGSRGSRRRSGFLGEFFEGFGG